MKWERLFIEKQTDLLQHLAEEQDAKVNLR